MKLKKLITGFIVFISIMCMSFTALAASNNNVGDDLQVWDQDALEELVRNIDQIKKDNAGLSEDEIINLIEKSRKATSKSIIDIWNSLTESEKNLVIRYPFAALDVNTAKNIATTQTERMFGYNGLGDRSDAFRHGIWNAEMTILIGKEKAELFATAHEDKDVTGNESDGYPKAAHKEMDLHNNIVGRDIGESNNTLSQDQMAQYIFDNINSQNTNFIWLHE